MLAALAGLTLLLAATATTAELKVGDQAPPIKVAKWIKGSPPDLGRGNLNVVEFWATWCGPCKQSIPHITELAKKYKGQVNFTGISVWEEKEPKDDSYIDKVVKFVSEWGDKMNYNVAADGHEGTMAQTWMAAAGQNGIPTAFIIDKDGRIAWIGHPMEMDDVLAKVVAGTWDVKAAAEKARKAEEETARRMEMMAPLSKAVEAKDYKQAVIEIDKIIATQPEMEKQLGYAKFSYLAMSDEAAAQKYARRLLTGIAKNEPMLLNDIAWAIAGTESKFKKPDYKLAIEMAKRGVELTKEENAFVLDTLAYAYYKTGDKKNAIKYQEKAVAVVEKAGDTIPAATAKEIKDRLLMYKG